MPNSQHSASSTISAQLGALAKQHPDASSPLEAALAGLWASVLELDAVQRDDDFFLLGGDSQRGEQLVAHVKTFFGIELPLRALFAEASTVANMAKAIEAIRKAPPTEAIGTDASAPSPTPRTAPLEGDATLARPPAVLSHTQRRVWFLAQLDPESHAYVEARAYRLRGALDLDALRASVIDLVARHEMLRTTFKLVDDEPRQFVQPEPAIDFRLIDLSVAAGTQREHELAQVLKRAATQPFDLSAGPLLRVRLVRLAEDSHVLLRAWHHIVSDGWSSSIFDHEIAAFYNARRDGQRASLPPLELQYADYAVAQSEWLLGPGLREQLDFWRTKLAGLSPLALPTDRPRPPIASDRGAQFDVAIPQRLREGLNALGRKEGATLFMTALTAFKVLLYRYGGTDDVAVGTPIAARNRADLEGLIGFFANTLVLRTDLAGEPSFRELLARVRETALGAYTHQDTPFEKLVEVLAPERDLSRNPLFQLCFALQNTPRSPLPLQGLEVERCDLPVEHAKFDLTLELKERDGQFIATWEYCTDLFEETTIRRMAQHFETLLQAALDAPDTPISRLPLLSQQERQQILVEWNRTQRDYPLDQCVHQLIEAQVQRSPQSIAVLLEEQQLTYAELNARANRLAHHLRTLGVGPDVLVGLCMERSLELVVGLVAILKAGGAYVPLDPEYPPERLALMLADSAAPVVLTQSHLRGVLPLSADATSNAPVTLCLDDAALDLSGYPDTDPVSLSAPEDLAYVIYTSGSTGTPKGALLERRGLCNYIHWFVQRLSLTPADRILQSTSISFDASLLELFAPLTLGAPVVLAPPGEQLDLSALLRRTREQHITVQQFVPTALRAALAESAFAACDHLRCLISGGEALEAKLARECLVQLPYVQLLNVYGPTEATDVVAMSEVRDLPEHASSVPIGRPIANVQCYILDAHLQPLPIGVVGELYIGGSGVGRGYRNRPELTAERFVPDPFRPGERLYRTGDLARYLPDGTIEYVGRIDHQVKLRGFRIELGEIEATLNACAGVRESVVIARTDQPGVTRLVGYAAGEGLAPAALREALKARLPEYMVPAAIVVLDSLPTLPNGKLDRKALPVPEFTIEATQYLAPRSDVEEALAQVWAEVLGVERVGVHDNFFDLGGHSLLATRVIARVRNLFGDAPPVRALFEAPTVAGFALRLSTQAKGPGTALSAIPKAGQGPYPPSAAQTGLWFLDRLLGGTPQYNLGQTVRLSGPLDVPALQRALQSIVDRHSALRTAFVERDGVAVQVEQSQVTFALPLVRLDDLAPEERERALIDALTRQGRSPFHLAQAPLIRAQLLRLAEQDHVLQVTMHHIVSDGWSSALLSRELQALYGAYSAGLPSPLAPLPIQFADFAAWEQARLQRGELAAQLHYWRAKLAGLEPLQLASDFPRPASMTYRGGMERIALPESLVSDLRALARRHNATLFMVLLAGFKVLLARHSGQHDIAIGTPIDGRDRPELQDMIGYLLNTLVLRTDLGEATTFAEALARVRQTALEAYSHPEVPFDHLVADLSPVREWNRNPLFDVMINFIEGFDAPWTLPGLTTSEIGTGGRSAKFALTLYVEVYEGRLELRLVYQSELFAPPRIAELLAQYIGLLTQCAADPGKPLGAYSLLTERARHLLPDPSIVIERPAQQPIVELILANAASTPNRVAVRYADKQWTYGELVARATALAAALGDRGISRGDVVAIEGPRSFALAGAMLGVLLAGAVFLTIDPALPAARKQTMRQQSGAKLRLVLGEAQVPDAEQPLPALPLDADLALLARPASLAGRVPILPAVREDDPAYVFFTSGSTGQPKAILGNHRGLSHFLGWQRERFCITADDRVSQLIGLSFDPLLRDVFLPLTAGATLCIPQESDLLDVPAWLAHEHITVVHTSPTVMQSWLTGSPRGGLAALRWLFVAGEPLTDALVLQWRQRFPGGTQIVNLYGPTETTMVKCAYVVPETVVAGVQPAGTPLPQTQALVLNGQGQPCGVGELGEIVLRTPFRSNGYLNLPEENAKRFRPNPFRDDPADLLYFTGDRGRYRTDGLLEIAGRIDDQVKIRGVRVEPAEVSAVLARHEAVRQCVVVARKEPDGSARLVGYVVPHTGTTIDARALRAYLKALLPDAFVPGAFVFLAALPLLPNGKVDRRALPAPLIEAGADEHVAPRSPLEQLLAEPWAELLERDDPGVHEDFFAHGGHSLLATQLLARIAKVLSVQLPLRGFFETPTIAGLAALVEHHRGQADTDVLPPLVATTQSESAPLSFTQQRLWFIDRLNPGSATYNVEQTLRLVGTLDVAVLQRALDVLVARHAALRTRVVEVDGQASQRIDSAAQLALELVDLTESPESERESRAEAHLRALAMQPFDLRHCPLARAHLVRLAPTLHLLGLSIHHIVADGWSLGILGRELWTLYDDQCNRTETVLPDLPITYADFASWQQQLLSTTVLERQLTYWKRQLAGVDTVALPTDHPRPAQQSYRGAELAVTLPTPLLDGLKALSRGEGATLFMSALAAFNVLLYRYSGTADVAVGTPIAGRHRTELEGIVGFFANTLVMRTDLSGAPTFRQLLARVRETALGAYSHQDAPFEKLVEALAPARDLSRNPLFQISFALQNTPRGLPAVRGLEIRRNLLPADRARFDLTLNLMERDEKLLAYWGYCTDLFAHATIERMARHFERLIESILAAPDTPITRLELLTPDEREQLIHTWNDTARDYPRDFAPHALIEAQVARTPHAPALHFEDLALSYAELDARANRLAHALRERGVGPDVLVGLCIERGPALLEALLAVLKAGGAYVPLDPEFPSERLAYMLEDSGAKVLVTQERLRGLLAPGKAALLNLDDAADELRAKPDTPPAVESRAEHLAYVIYTSGSTGKPKGVAVPRGAVTNFLVSMAREPGIAAADRLVAVTTLSFDIAVLELLVPLTVGATVVLASRAQAVEGHALRRLIETTRASVMQATPSTWRLLVEAEWQGSPQFKALVGGEALPPDLATALIARTGALWNMYGPTETTVWSTCGRIEHPEAGISIGRPIANTAIRVLDEQGELVPIGVLGEICIGGDGVTRGYLGRPELTAERLIDDPYAPGARLYRTGDLGRWRADGLLEYKGRADGQVKLRGYRIELGEIEAALAARPEVREAAVLLREDAPNDKRLVAYFVANSATAPDTDALSAALQQHLPAYMVPSSYVVLEHLPLTANGKIDRRALPAPDVARSSEFVAPATPLEVAIAELWQSLLYIDRVGAQEDFFALGGHSLLAGQLVARLVKRFDVDLPLRSIFEAPTVARLARVVEQRLSAHAPSTTLPITPAAPAGAYPLSFAQQRLWFLDRLTPGSATYNIADAVRLQGHLDAEALHGACDALLARHDALRTRFVELEGEALQVVERSASIEFEQHDLSDQPASSREQRARELIRAADGQGFDLQRGALIRVLLVRLAADEHILMLNVHHIVSDGWSSAIMLHELSALYNARIAGAQADLPALPVQYVDYSVWQRESAAATLLEHQLAYWKEQLAGVDTLALPTDRSRPALQSDRGARISTTLPASTLARLKALSREEGATLFMAALAAFNVLLHRYSGTVDIAVGTPIAGRNRTELEGLVGFFANTLVLRTDLSGEPTFRQLLARVRETALGAYASQDVPFERLVEALAPQRDLSRNPLFQVCFALDNVSAVSPDFTGIEATPVPMPTEYAKFDLTLTVRERADGLRAAWEYCTDLFEQATVRRMAQHFETLLESILADPDRPITQLALLTPAERQQLLIDWNATDRNYPLERTWIERFEAQVRATPTAIALVEADRQLTYAELNARANCLAHHLRDSGVVANSLVGVCMQRSITMLVGVLAILKAGGAYVPLDPAYPEERLRYMLDDAHARLVLTDAASHARLAPTGVRTLCLDEQWSAVAEHLERDPAPTVSAEDLAYIIYTSGSTGAPKGVMITHRALSNHLCWIIDQLRLNAQDRILQYTSISFDASVWEMLGPLQAGATLVLAAPEIERDMPALAGALEQHRISVFQSVPSAYRALLDVPGFARCASLRYLICGGEALDRALARALVACVPAATLGNFYGPTEATIDATCLELDALDERPGTVPIGRPIANARCHVLDAHREPVPIGVLGELYVGGVGLARGYLNRPELTAERFVPDPFRPGERLYRTGDLARYLPDGTIEYVGRIDHQVKLRGFRIELGEIEATLAAHPQVRDVAVVVREDVAGDKRLVAYVGAAPDTSPSSDALDEFLRSRLPAFMLPGAFVVLERLPLTATGKVDRRALPAPEYDRTRAGSAFIAPRTELEALVAETWRDVLRLPSIGVADDFFRLGGHSLLAGQLVARLVRVTGVDVPLRQIFETPTVAGLARAIELAHGSGARGALPRIEARERSGPEAPSFAQQRLWFVDQVSPGSAAYNIVTAVRLSGPLDLEALRHALDALIARHESLRTRFTQIDGEPRQIIAPSAPLPIAFTDLSGLPAAEREARALAMVEEEDARPFDLKRGPLLRVTLLRLEGTTHVLVLNMHHIVSDGWSAMVFERELSALYNAKRAGRALTLAPLPLQYADYARWQREWLSGAVLEQQLAYWREQLASVATLDLPTDFSRPAVQSHRGNQLNAPLPESVYAGLKELSRTEGATLFMTALAAFQVLLHRYSGSDDITVGTPIAGRSRSELEALIGFFANTLVLRTDLSGAPSFRQLLARTRETALGAYTHQDLPFERLVEALAPERDLSRNPLFQVAFALQSTPATDLNLVELAVQRIGLPNYTAKFDLTLILRERDGRLWTHWEYCADLFERATIERMARHFTRLLESIIAAPGESIAHLALLDDAERAQLLHGWNETAADYPQQASLAALFEAQVARTPQQVAVVHEGAGLTYAELNARANQLAHALRDRGVTPGQSVAVFLERSAMLAVALVGIVKAGAAYVPLDADLPTERLSLMLEDCGARVLLTQHRFLERLPPSQAAPLCLDRDWSSIATAPCVEPIDDDSPAQLAYVMYTSGSTGKPKGVAVRQASVIRLVANPNYVSLSPGDTMAQVSNVAFDAATFEIWGALLHGARLAILPRDIILAPQTFVDALLAHRVSCMFLTTALFNRVTTARPDAFRSLRYVLFGGEACDPDRVRAVLQAGPPEQLLHVYGPTETTTFATFHVVTEHDRGQTIPIGLPISETEVILLDAHRELVPIGVLGEIYIGGRGVASGYLHRPEDTRARFLPHPLRPESGEVVYRTGDLARRRADGAIEFVGRNDDQVKIRGFRIEPAEIATVLSTHPAITACHVVARRQPSGEMGLSAYVVADQSDAGDPTPSELRAFLAARLPSYMLPTSYIAMPTLPLTQNGKVDVRALPAPSSVDGLDRREHVAPRDDTERLMCRIWSEVLNVESIGIDDSFFAIGGHSLLAAKLFARLDEAFGRSLPLGILFTAPTVRMLAEHYRTTRTVDSQYALVALTRGGSQLPVYAVPGVFGNVVGFADLARALGPDQPFFGLQSIGLDGRTAPLDSIEAMARHYVGEMRAVQPQGPYAVMGACFGATVAYEVARQLMAAGEEVAMLGLLDPTTREGDEPDEPGVALPRTVTRVAAVGDFVTRRLRLYRREMAGLTPAQRIKYLARKLRTLGGSVAKANAFKGAERELNQLEVYRANVLALDRYHRKPLVGRLRRVEIFETGPAGPDAAIDWQDYWTGEIVRHTMPGKDSGDMLSGDNAPIVAGVLAERLRQAFSAAPAPREARATISKVYS